MADPVYTTKEKVKETLQGGGDITIPETLTDVWLDERIEERSREIDTRLPNYTLFPDISVTPVEGPPKVYGTPKVIQMICRKLAAADCLRFLGLARNSETGADLTEEKGMNNLLTALASGSAEIPPGEYDYSQLSGESEREVVDPNKPKSLYIGSLTRED